jgi:hypothetical protein
MVLILEANGIDVETASEATDILARHLSKAANELSIHFHENMHERIGDAGPDLSGQVLNALKPIALEAASVIFAQEIQHALERLLHEGRLAPKKSGRAEENEGKPSKK